MFRVQATDSDRSHLHRQLRYWIPNPVLNNLGGHVFTIEATSGIIRVQQPLDREALINRHDDEDVMTGSSDGTGDENVMTNGRTDGDVMTNSGADEDVMTDDVILEFDVHVSDMNVLFGEMTIKNASAKVLVRVLDDNDVTPNFTQGKNNYAGYILL